MTNETTTITLVEAREMRSRRVAWSTVGQAEGARRERLLNALGRAVIAACSDSGADGGAEVRADLVSDILGGRVEGDIEDAEDGGADQMSEHILSVVVED